MKILFVADRVELLKPAGDSTLAMVRAALKRGHEVRWATAEDVEFVGDTVKVGSATVLDCAADGAPTLDTKKFGAISSVDVVFIRKDPPFDSSYVKLCWLLALAEKKVRMVNPPSLLLRYHEKLVPLEAVAQGFLGTEDLIPTHIGSKSHANEFIQSLKPPKVITKPFLGFAGGNIELRELADFLSSTDTHADSLTQPFQEEIHKYGDRRVFFLDGKLLAHFVRRPKPGGYVSNLAQGGTAGSEPLTKKEEAVIERLGRFLKAAGIILAGADLIGHYVSEVNITSPTGLRSLEKLEQKDYASDIIAHAENMANG